MSQSITRRAMFHEISWEESYNNPQQTKLHRKIKSFKIRLTVKTIICLLNTGIIFY